MNGENGFKKMKTIKINHLLQFFNLLVACLIFSGFFRDELVGHLFINKLTLILGLFLCLQVHITLRFKSSNQVPFITIMAFVLIFFFSFRIFTLLLYPIQPVFQKYTYEPYDSNFALIYILLANCFIYTGFYFVKLKDSLEIITEDYIPSIPRLALIVFFITLIFGLFIQNTLPGAIKYISNLIFNNFFTPNKILIVFTTYIIVFRKHLPLMYMRIVFLCALLLVILQTLSFSRSGFLTLLEILLIVISSLLPNLKFSRKIMSLVVLLIPVIFSSVLFIYSVSTLSRHLSSNQVVTLSQRIKIAKISSDFIKSAPTSNPIFGKALSRAGYFDFSAELIANKDKYSKIFKIETYFKSIIDNIFTPGFNIFDQPFLSNSLKYVYSGNRDPSKISETSGYHTDQFGIYGEMYNLFGYFSFILFYFMSWSIKKAYVYKGALNPLELGIKKIFLLIIFHKALNSFGFDWLLFDSIIYLVSFYAITKLFRLVRFPQSHTASSAARII